MVTVNETLDDQSIEAVSADNLERLSHGIQETVYIKDIIFPDTVTEYKASAFDIASLFSSNVTLYINGQSRTVKWSDAFNQASLQNTLQGNWLQRKTGLGKIDVNVELVANNHWRLIFPNTWEKPRLRPVLSMARSLRRT